MSDYYHAKKMNSCPKDGCNGNDKSRGTYKFKCDECSMMFP